MAAITPIKTETGAGTGSAVIRIATAQANTGQTDWVTVPSGATLAIWSVDVTAVAGTTPIVTPSLQGLGPSADDARQVSPFGTALTGTLTAAGQFQVAIGLGVTEQVAIGTAKPAVLVPGLPFYLGLTLTLDRTTGNETYTYSSAIRFAQ
jgi:hypothetical protein